MMDRIDLVQLKLFLPTDAARKSSAALIKSAVEALEKRHLSLAPATPGDRAALDGIAPRPRIVFRHPDFPENSDSPDSFVTIAAGTLDRLKTDFVLVGMLIRPTNGQPDAAWQVGLTIARILAPGLDAGYALMNGGRADVDRSLFPESVSATGDELPPAFTPWTYLGEPKLTRARREALLDLDAVRSRALDQGWEVRLLESLADEPPRNLTKALKTLARNLAYRGPQ